MNDLQKFLREKKFWKLSKIFETLKNNRKIWRNDRKKFDKNNKDFFHIGLDWLSPRFRLNTCFELVKLKKKLFVSTVIIMLFVCLLLSSWVEKNQYRPFIVDEKKKKSFKKIFIQKWTTNGTIVIRWGFFEYSFFDWEFIT